MARDIVDSDKMAASSNEELREQIIADIEADEQYESYRDLLEEMLEYNYYLEDLSVDNYTTEELEKFWIRAEIEEQRMIMQEGLEEDYQIIITEDSTPQKLATKYYQARLEEYHFKQDLTDKEWYELQELYFCCLRVKALQVITETNEDLSNYDIDGLKKLEKQLEIKHLKDDYNVTEDLSGYSLEKLYDLEQRLVLEEEIRDYDYKGDLSQYDYWELNDLAVRLSVEKMFVIMVIPAIYPVIR